MFLLLYAEPYSCQHPYPRLRDIAEVIVSAVGNVRSLHVDRIFSICPLEFQIESGIWVVGHEAACACTTQVTRSGVGVGALVENITAHAVLPT